ncbi:MAG: PIN domain-containing protein [Terriglobus roseus]|nr:PIN domain-containing protein [Terriglobus roseus]
MKLIDANLLLFSYDPGAAMHTKARRWFEQTLSSGERIGIPMLAISAFVRISTDKRLPRTNLRMADALGAVQSWLNLDNVEVIHTSNKTWQITVEVLRSSGVTGSMITDVQLAALAIEHGATLYSNDRDFARFKQVRWIDPFADRA